ncbi:MAG: hypothetical protein AABM29_02410 [Actinomycetota bacterium]
MRIGTAVGVSCLAASLALLVASAPAVAAKKPITGKLSKSGYTVLALAANGKTTAARANPRRFKLRPPAKRVTLHLRAKDGTYAGPIVVTRKKRGKRAILGVKAGAKLGRVKVKAGKGYAKVKRKPPRKLIDAKRKARAKKGAPIGAGNFGRVPSANTKGGAPGDRDLDGVADPLDIDDDGDLTLDNFELSGAARVSQAANTFNTGSDFPLFFEASVNANAFAAAGFTPEQIDQQILPALPSVGRLGIGPLPGDSTELDCGDADTGLIYCRRNGSIGRFVSPPSVFHSDGVPFPSSFDGDGDGFGTVPPGPAYFAHGARIDQIGTGDVLIEHVTTGAPESECPPPPDTTSPFCASYTATLQYVFGTVPALVSYSDTAGNCAKASGTPGSCATEFSYPVAPGGLGTPGNAFPVSAPGGQDVMVTFTFWRPQRQPIGEGQNREACLDDVPPCRWVDMGGLTYGALIQYVEGESGLLPGCPTSAFTETDPDLEPFEGFNQSHFRDMASDQAANPADTITYSLNLSQCLAAINWEPGESLGLTFQATAANSTDITQQGGVLFERQP